MSWLEQASTIAIEFVMSLIKYYHILLGKTQIVS